jgi:trehalose 6-phosphate synthase
MTNTPPSSPDSFLILDAPVSQRLIVVSNRLPVTVQRTANGRYTFKESSGGLATGMAGVKREVEMLWYGWPGIEISTQDEPEVTQTLRQNHKAVPVMVDDSTADAYYNGFSSEFLSIEEGLLRNLQVLNV